MKKASILMSILILSGMMVSCVGNEPTRPLENDVNIIATIVAATLTAFPSATAALEPTATLVSSPSMPSLGQWSVIPSYAREEDAQFLFRVEFDTNQWEIKDDSQSIYGVKRKTQYLSHRKLPQCAIFQTAGYGLSSDYSVEHGQKNIGGIAFETSSIKLNGVLVYVNYFTDLNLGNPYSNIFGVGGSDDCLKAGEEVLATLKAISKNEITPTP